MSDIWGKLSRAKNHLLTVDPVDEFNLEYLPNQQYAAQGMRNVFNAWQELQPDPIEISGDPQNPVYFSPTISSIKLKPLVKGYISQGSNIAKEINAWKELGKEAAENAKFFEAKQAKDPAFKRKWLKEEEAREMIRLGKEEAKDKFGALQQNTINQLVDLKKAGALEGHGAGVLDPWTKGRVFSVDPSLPRIPGLHKEYDTMTDSLAKYILRKEEVPLKWWEKALSENEINQLKALIEKYRPGK